MSLSGQLLKPFLRPLLAARFHPKHSIASQRKHFERVASVMLSPSGTECEAVELDKCSGFQLRPAAPQSPSSGPKAMLFLHGGAYIIGSADSYRAIGGRYAKALNCTVLLPDYRLAPEHPFPAALEDAYAGWQALLAQGFAPEDIVVAGDSAGGGLGTALCLKLRDRAEALPKALFLISPWMDLDLGGESLDSRAEQERVLNREWINSGREAYANGLDYRMPYLSPLYAELHDLMPMLIQVGSDEVLFDDSSRFAASAEKYGAHITLEEWQGMWHDWHLFAPLLPEANRAIADSARWLRSHYE